ncbi:MAG: alpha/beta hydrolase [Kangiellaceae bacterium]|nr:alpha/beta hydrolase [Kangiellaceae bacterium]MCW8999623.1 alpha/beta hydrolase [Kangiellaceae bacterium]
MSGTVDPSKTNCQRIPFWLDSESTPVYCCLHVSSEQRHNQIGVVICSPLGFEYTHSHRTLRHLADRLASAGIPTIRFDYHGSGDSDADLRAIGRVEKIQQNIGSTINQLKQATGVTQVCLIGVRLGATLAALYTEQSPIDKLILWSPCVKGRAYVREMMALEKLAAHSEGTDQDFIDSGGFILSNETAESLGQINLLKMEYSNINNVLLIERSDLKTDQKLLRAISNKETRTSCEHYLMEGYADMMAEPQETKIPFDTIEKVVNWIKPQNTAHSDFEIQTKDFKQVAFHPSANSYERICYPIGSNLIGILTTPKATQDKPIPLVVLANSGSVHRVGPNRLYVELARELGKAGIASFRFDLRNLGESVMGLPVDENHPYPHDSTADIEDIINHLQSHFEYDKFVLAGLCSGAHNVFHAAIELEHDKRINEVIMINPLAFYRRPHNFQDNSKEQEMAKDSEQYRKSLLDPSKWKQLFSKRGNLGYIFKFVIRLLWKKLASLFFSVARIFGIAQQTQLSKDLNQYRNSDTHISFFIASKDPGKKILMDNAKSTVNSMIKAEQLFLYDIENADHTFSNFQCRSRFIQKFVKHILNKYLK